MPRRITIDVVEQDGLTARTDVLVLKHAQALYGLDARVVDFTGIPKTDLPKVNGFRLLCDPPQIAASAVLFIGMPPISELEYPEIRQFGFKALCQVSSTLPAVTDISMTIHGVGYGLDETACFEAQMTGILDAVQSGDIPRTLKEIKLLEINPGRAKRLRERLRAVAPSGFLIVEGDDLATPSDELTSRVEQAARSDRRHAFVAMPFHDDFDDVFAYGITNAVHRADLLCERIDKQPFTGDVLERVKEKIVSSAVVVADLTGSNANVFLEIGYAWGKDVPTVLVCKQGDDLKFDVRGQRCLFYTNIKDLEGKLGDELESLRASWG